jgi:signal transduction histidine kinase
MIDEHADATVVSVTPGADKAIVTVDGTGSIIEASPSLGVLLGASPVDGAVEGRSLTELIAPGDQAALLDLLVATTDDTRMANGVRLTATGRRDDGLPLLLDLHVPAAAALTTNVPLDARISLVVARAGGPVTWADDPQPPTPERAGPDHVLSHDARAQVRNARNFLGLFARKVPESGADPELLPVSFLDTSLRALASGDEILDRIVWFLRLEHDPIALRGVSLAQLVELARRQSQSTVDEWATIEGQEDLAAPVAVAEAGTDLEVVGNSELLVWVLAELMTNARKFAKEPTALTIDTRRLDRWVEVRVANTGHRIDASLAPDAFKLGRMLQGRGERPGVGLGLSLCRRIVLRHAGRMRIEPSDDGTVVTFSLLVP